MSSDIQITFEGESIPARRGESLAATLAAHGVKVFRTTRYEAERGMFCGMGVCQDCLVEVDGKPNRRACMTKVEGPLAVRREAHARPLAPVPVGQPSITVGEIETMEPELLVIGAGPGGLSAAIAARRVGADVVVVDERGQPGGQYFKQLDVDAPPAAPPDAQHREGAALIEEARRLGVVIRPGMTVWGAFEPNEFAATVEGCTQRLLPKAAIIATGAFERGWLVPGWTLPGVMTTGAAQTLWRTARRLPGKRVLIAGNGPLNLQLAAELIAGGAEVVAVVEAAPKPGLAQAGLITRMILAAPQVIRAGLHYHAARRAGNAAMIHDMIVAGVEKTAAGLSVRLQSHDGGSEQRHEVDALCLGYGFEPSNELLRAVGCGHDYDPVRRQLITRRDGDGLTDVPGIYALGDCTGLGGARAALAEGVLVGAAAAVALGRRADADLVARVSRARADLARHRRFQEALWSLYAAPAYTARLATPDTLLCRCEELTFGQIEEALSEEMRLMGAIKRRTRVGMGRCQGRYCAPVLDALIAERYGRPRDEFTGFAPRVPVKPVAIEDLARLG
jgi:thioredoxin reductase